MAKDATYQLSPEDDDDDNVKTVGDSPKKARLCSISPHHMLVAFILFTVNLVNYMDRSTLAGIGNHMMKVFDINEKTLALVQMAFIVSYMLVSPLVGYLGDRRNRKQLMVIGIAVWTVVSFLSSLVSTDQFWQFVVLRALVGVGEASYSTLAPVIISDMFIGTQRTVVLTLFQFAVPAGSGLGYIVSRQTLQWTGDWRWSYRIVPILTTIAGLLLACFTSEPVRGEAEGARNRGNTHTYLSDLKYLMRIPSFNFANLGFVCIAFTVGALAFWAPQALEVAAQVVDGVTDPAELAGVSLKFGIVTMIAGVVGVLLGSISARVLKPKTDRADALVCAIGLLVASPIIFCLLYFLDESRSTAVSSQSVGQAYVLTFFALTGLCLNWVLIVEITMDVVVPTCRSSACAVQILLGHVLGDAISPYLCGFMIDAIRAGGPDDATDKEVGELKLKAYEQALYITSAMSLLGAISFFICSYYISRDIKRRLATQRSIEETPDDSGETSISLLRDRQTSSQYGSVN